MAVKTLPTTASSGSSGTRLRRHLESSAGLVMTENQRALNSIDWGSVVELINLISRADSVFMLGEGRSGLVVRMVAMRLMHLGHRVHVVGETTTPAMGNDDLLIAVSGSGGTPGVVVVAEQARTVGGAIAAVTTGTSSPLAGIADLVIPTPAASKHDHGGQNSAQFAGSLFEQTTLLLFDAVFHALSQELGKTPEVLWASHTNLE